MSRTAPAAFTLRWLEGGFAVVKLDPADPVPQWALSGEFWSVTGTGEELSVVCRHAAVPSEFSGADQWRCLRVTGTLAFSETGILSGLARPLAEADISLFAVSTFDTDYLLIPAASAGGAQSALETVGYRFENRL